MITALILEDLISGLEGQAATLRGMILANTMSSIKHDVKDAGHQGY
jgi:hypothetical protein